MSVSIPLLPMSTLGRSFQLLALALGDREGKAKINPEIDTIEFPHMDAYVEFVMNTYKVLYDLHVGKVLPLEGGVPEDVENKLCENSPKLYRHDLRKKKRQKKQEEEEQQKREEEQQEEQEEEPLPGKNVCARATSYVRKVVGRELLSELIPLPITLKATLYSMRRPVVPTSERDDVEEREEGEEEEKIMVSPDSVGMAFLGMMASYVGSKEGKVEYYVVPTDVVDPSYVRAVLQVLKLPGEEDLPSIAQKLEKNVGLSSDLATYLALLYRAIIAEEAGRNAFGLAREAAYERFLIVKVMAGEDRPDISWMAPLSLSVPLEVVREQRLERALKSVYSLISFVEKGGSYKERAKDVVRECFNSLAISIFTNVHPVGRKELIYKCLRTSRVALREAEEKVREAEEEGRKDEETPLFLMAVKRIIWAMGK